MADDGDLMEQLAQLSTLTIDSPAPPRFTTPRPLLRLCVDSVLNSLHGEVPTSGLSKSSQARQRSLFLRLKYLPADLRERLVEQAQLRGLVDDDSVELLLQPQAESVDMSGCVHLTDNALSSVVGFCGRKITQLRLNECIQITNAGLILLAHGGMPALQTLCLVGCNAVGTAGLKVPSFAESYLARFWSEPDFLSCLSHAIDVFLVGSGAIMHCVDRA
jgi:hypothetical protein